MIDLIVKNKSKNELPVYATPGSSGFDIRANVGRTTAVLPGHRAIIPTGLYFNIPEGYELQIRSRSGLAAEKGILVLHGTIDSDYKGELCIILFNFGDSPFEIEPGDRIAQGVLASVTKANIIEGEIDTSNDRGGGLGHTGVK